MVTAQSRYVRIAKVDDKTKPREVCPPDRGSSPATGVDPSAPRFPCKRNLGVSFYSVS